MMWSSYTDSLDIVGLLVLFPVFVKLVHFTGGVALLSEIERFVHFTETTLAK